MRLRKLRRSVVLVGRRLRAFARFIGRGVPVMLDLAGFAAIVVGVSIMWGAWGWIAAGVLLIVAGLRAQS